MYFEARYYDPLSGRFISPDPLFGEQMDKCLSSVIECNLYQYTGNNPVNFSDSTGLVLGKIGSRGARYGAEKIIDNLRARGVKAAWKMEQQLVASGRRGTVDWSETEKIELLARGKVTGYGGHHINNVADNMADAGNSANIQFMKKCEHQCLHRGNGGTHVPTSGPYIDRTDGGALPNLYDQYGLSMRYSEGYRALKSAAIVSAISLLSNAASAMEVLDYLDPLNVIFHIEGGDDYGDDYDIAPMPEGWEPITYEGGE